MRLLGAFCAAAAAATGCASSAPRAPLEPPRVQAGATEVVFDNHLPSTFRVASLVAAMDGEVVYNAEQATPRVSMVRANLPEGGLFAELTRR